VADNIFRAFQGHLYLLEIPTKTILFEFIRSDAMGKPFSTEESLWVSLCCREAEAAATQIGALRSNSVRQRQMSDFLISVVKSIFMEVLFYTVELLTNLIIHVL
jgi:hypothetical protein